MIYVIFGLMFISLSLAVIFYVLFKNTSDELEETKHVIDEVISTNHILMKQIDNLHREERIKSDNKKVENEKINNLHDGDTVANAVAKLSKHKNSSD